MKLYRILREHCENGDCGNERVHGREVLYCGYERAEAARVYFGNLGSGYDVPGHYFSRIRAQSIRVRETVS